jgi:PAT family beta-lactamase induction signal transducer AmpG
VRARDVFRSRRVLVVALLGFSSGLPYLLTGQTLGAWMTAEQVDLTTIGLFAFVATPYSFKWLWAPLLDRFRLPFLGRRRGWLLVFQLALAAAILTMGSIDPREAPVALAACAVLVAALSASQDLMIDALNADTLLPDERAAGSSLYVTGYKLGMLVAGTLTIALADRVPWRLLYGALAPLLAIGVVGTLLAVEPSDADAPRPTLAEALWRPLARLFTQPRAAIVLAFVALYRLCDFFATLMVVPFLKRGVGFSFPEIALLYQLTGFAGTFVGGLIGGGLVARAGVRRCLIGFGTLQAITNLGWAALALSGRSVPALIAVVTVDNLAGAMASGVFVAYLMSRVDRAHSATQLALLTSLSSLGMRGFGFAAAMLADQSWVAYWCASACLVVPALVLTRWLPD